MYGRPYPSLQPIQTSALLSIYALKKKGPAAEVAGRSKKWLSAIENLFKVRK